MNIFSSNRSFHKLKPKAGRRCKFTNILIIAHCRFENLMLNMIKLRKLPLLNHADFNFHNTLIATLYYAYCLTNSVKAICFSVLSKQHST